MKKKGHTPITRVKNPVPIVIDPDFLVYIPDGFTPNNDLKND